jgi:hypothetical protein
VRINRCSEVTSRRRNSSTSVTVSGLFFLGRMAVWTKPAVLWSGKESVYCASLSFK